ncbi:16S rRNA (guanine(527)-N(7))-methyltransferase RsmG [Gymnodinialimonas sp. 2305UL16-5]|uniref:16S rRNA (guanine(527)-N(7))-methyltransferase RsmG n=1 Tax=Gymnodinialimonas mytili TaxID=3126503 RepID=UPI0030A0C0F1
MTEDEARAHVLSDVSRETSERLDIYQALLLKWQRTINLVAPKTLDVIWSRHFLDSAQLWDIAGNVSGSWLDLGSGGGFPGLVIAAIAAEKSPDLTVTLVESDIRKCGFLRETARAMGIKVNILSRRIDQIPQQNAQVVSARALSQLDQLVAYATPHLAQGAIMLFPKGATYQDELETLDPDWQTKVDVVPSQTDPSAVILRFHN